MKLNTISRKEVLTCAAIGTMGALIFLFVFPKGAISTLMHEVLHLPGPGAGIALVLGPFLIFVLLVSSLLNRSVGGALVTSLAFAIACALVVWLLEIPTNPKGAFGSALFIVAVAVCGIAAEAMTALGTSLRPAWRCMISGAVANAALLLFYWIIIFPRTCGWIDWKDTPVLTGLCLASGIVSGYVAYAVSRPLLRTFALKEE